MVLIYPTFLHQILHKKFTRLYRNLYMGLWAAFWPLIPIGHLRLFRYSPSRLFNFCRGAYCVCTCYSYRPCVRTRIPCCIQLSQGTVYGSPESTQLSECGGHWWRQWVEDHRMRPVLRSRTGPLVGSRLSPDRALRRVCSCSDATDGEWIWIGSESVNRQNIELKHLTRYRTRSGSLDGYASIVYCRSVLRNVSRNVLVPAPLLSLSPTSGPHV